MQLIKGIKLDLHVHILVENVRLKTKILLFYEPKSLKTCRKPLKAVQKAERVCYTTS